MKNIRDEKEILYFKTEKERMAYLRNKIVIEPVEYVPKEEEKPKPKKRGKKNATIKEVQTD